MRRSLPFLAVLASLLWLAGCAGEKSTPAEQDFAERYRAAHASGEVEQMLVLHWLEGVTEQDQFLLRMAIEQELTYPIKNLHFEPTAPEDDYRYEHDGRTWGPNLKPVKRLVVVFDNPENLHTSYLLGEQNGRYYFVNASSLSE